MPTARLFIAVSLDERIKLALKDAIQDLHKLPCDCAWVNPQNWHITLRFLGQTSLERLPELRTLVRKAAQRPAFEVAFSGFGAFPGWAHPRVIWIGIGTGAEELREMAAELGPSEVGRDRKSVV
jgi:2'-5' RNA ligase